MTTLAQNQSFEQTAIVAFNGASLVTAKIKDVIYVAMRPIVEAIGLDWAGQTVKLNRSKEKFNCCDITTVAEDGKNRSMLFMPLRKLNGWLFSINPEKVRPDLKEAVIQYQEECFEVLHNYWTKGVAINPRQTITPEQQAILHSIVDRRVNGFDSLRGGLWKRHNKHFGIAKYNQLLASRFDDAVAYLESAELRYPKPKEKINDGCHFFAVKDGVVIYQLPISQQAINSELANNKPLLLEHIKQVVGEFVGQQALEHKPSENENNLVMISRDTTNKVMDYFAALRHEINRLGGKLPIAPNFDKDTIVRAVVTDMMDSSRMLVSFDFMTGKPQITFVPNDCFVATRDNLAQVIAGGDGVTKKYLPDIIKAAVNRLSGN